MAIPAPQSAEERGERWRQIQVQQLLADNAVVLASRAEGAPACYWGTGPETATTLYLCFEGDPEPKAQRFRRTMITDCGAGLYFTQHNATIWMRRRLKNMDILPA